MRRMSTAFLSAALLGSLVLGGTQCIPVPSIEEKAIELAVGSTLTFQFDAEGEFNVSPTDPIVTFDLSDSLDLEEILDDAGIDPDDLESIALTGAAYRVIEPDPTQGRRIENGSVDVERGGNRANLVTTFSIDVNNLPDFVTAPLDSAGVAIINGVLSDLLAATKAGTQPASSTLSFYVDGSSVPESVPTDFRWELRLYFSLVGVLYIDMIDF